MFSVRILFVFIFISLVIYTNAQNSPCSCSFTDDTGLTYDLSPLSIPANSPLSSYYSYQDFNNDYTYYINICGGINAQELDGCDDNTAVCQTLNNMGSSFSCGESIDGMFSSYDGKPSTNNQGVRITYTDGTFCSNGGPRTTHIDIGCNPNNQVVIDNIVEDAPCTYTIQMWSVNGCAVN